MGWVKWGLRAFLLLLVAGFLHYTLPQHDIVRIVNTYEERQELGDWTRIFWTTPDSQPATQTSRDVQFIQAITPDGNAMVYRNEDTGWHWPPYFKFDTATLYTEANDAISTKAAPEWVAVTHYGWRNEYLSIFPNAVGIRPVAGPDVRIIPWVSGLILLVLFAVFWAIRVRWLRFRAARIDPVLDAIAEGFEAAADSLAEGRGRLRRWWGRNRGK